MPAKAIEDTRERLRMLVAPLLEGKDGDKAQKFIWGGFPEMCLYAGTPHSGNFRLASWTWTAPCAGDLAGNSARSRCGTPSASSRMARQLEKEGKALPPLVTELLSSGKKSFYESAQGETSYFDLAAKDFKPAPEPEGIIDSEIAERARPRKSRKIPARA